MSKHLNKILYELHNFRFEPGYLNRLEELMDELRQCDDAVLAVEPVLQFVETHSDEDLGAPGPLVHWLEEYYKMGYEDLLVASIQRRPTPLNVWMLNRLINGSEGTEKDRYLSLMREVADSVAVALDVRELAEEFLTL
jgi:hypothetical protein